MSVRVRNSSDSNRIVLWVDGYLTVEDVGEVYREVRSVGGSPVLDLSYLRSADADGVKCLRTLMSRGVQVRGSSNYVAILLDKES